MIKTRFEWAFVVAITFAALILSGGNALAQEERSRIVASEYGFNAEDSTDALQRAIDSGAKTVVIDKQSSPWIVRPLKLRDNLELILEEGVEVQAKKGEFKEIGDVLLACDNTKNLTIRGEGKGATLRMRKREYWSEPYRKSEWRHGISLRSAEHVLIENLQIAETGGDGIYLGTSGTVKLPCRDVTIRRVDCVENNRQGISVINVDGLLIEDCVLRDTNGTPPAAGIDFEPNGADEQITNVVMRRVVAINNAGDGITFYLPQMRSRGHELSFVIEDCDSVRNAGMGFGLTVANGEDMRQTGEMIVRNTRFYGNRTGIAVRSKWADGAPLRFENVLLVTPNADRALGYDRRYKGVSSHDGLPKGIDEWTKTTASSGISLIATGADDEANGGTTFKDVTIVDGATPDATKPLFALRDASADGVGFAKVSGSIISSSALDSTSRVETVLNDETLATLFPFLHARRVPLWNLANLNAESEQATSDEVAAAWRDHPKPAAKPFRARGDATYYVFATPGEKTELAFRQRKIGSYEPKPVDVTITEPDGAEQKFDPALAVDEPLKIAFEPKTKGWSRVYVDFGASTVELESSSAPVLTAAAPKLDVFSSTGRFEFYVPKTARDLAFRVVGSATERVSATLFDPDGVEVARLDDVELLASWTNPLDESGAPEPIKSGFWTIQFDKPSVGVLEDYIFSIQGVPALLR